MGPWVVWVETKQGVTWLALVPFHTNKLACSNRVETKV